MSDRHVVATTMLIAGIMLGAFTVAKRPIKPASWNLGLQYNHAMRRNGAMNGRLARLLPLTRADYLQSSVTTRAARSNRYASPAVQRRLREFLLKQRRPSRLNDELLASRRQ